MIEEFDLVVAGGSPAGLSIAIQAMRAGLKKVMVARLPEFRIPGLPVSSQRLSIVDIRQFELVDGPDSEPIRILTDQGSYNATVCVVDVPPSPSGMAELDVPTSLADRVHTNFSVPAQGMDVLVVGGDELALVASRKLRNMGAQVVLSIAEQHLRLTMVGRQLLSELYRTVGVAVLFDSIPINVWDQDGYPMVRFSGDTTPDLLFDHLLFVEAVDTVDLKHSTGVEPLSDRRIFYLNGASGAPKEAAAIPGHNAWEVIRSHRFADLRPPVSNASPALNHRAAVALETQQYNATITGLDVVHDQLWRIRIRRDSGPVVHRPGQYCSLGLGYWEPRADESVEDGIDDKRMTLVRRSYSISSPILDSSGYLVDYSKTNEIELYIVWVTSDEGRVPALTPRLALKQIGDRVFLGEKAAGRYTSDRITNPSTPVVFFATGTGEAPHNAMIVQLLRDGHYGPILSYVAVRYLSDLGYLNEHRQLEKRYPNYRYVPLTTREPEIEKRYIQDLIEDPTHDEVLSRVLNLESTHVFLCGNPHMIGLPEEEDDGGLRFPRTRGAAELLHDRGFVLDRRTGRGNVHYEKYW